MNYVVNIAESVPVRETPPIPISDHEASVIDYYNRWHDFYLKVGECHLMLFEPGQAPDELGLALEQIPEARSAGMRRMTEAVVGPAGIGSSDYVVDAGCGLGSVAIQLASKHQCRVTGVNITPRQIAAAKVRALQAGLSEQVDFQWADCSQALPFDDGSVDVVICIEAACHFSDRSRFLQEVSRILKPGGRLAVEDVIIPDDFTNADCRQYIDPYCRAWTLPNLESRRSYTQKLHAAGLEVLEFTGFDGADAYNMRIAETHQKNSAWWLLTGSDNLGLREWHRAWSTFARGLRNEHFALKRFLAQKPEG